MTDQDICVELARFMGWPELTTATRSDFEGEPPPEAWYRSSCGRVLFYGQPAPWLPMNDPAQAAMVMAEAVRQGWTVDTACFSRLGSLQGRIICGREIFAAGAVHLLGAWCRAICFRCVGSGAPRESRVNDDRRGHSIASVWRNDLNRLLSSHSVEFCGDPVAALCRAVCLSTVMAIGQENSLR